MFFFLLWPIPASSFTQMKLLPPLLSSDVDTVLDEGNDSPPKAVEIESLTAIGRPLWSKRFSETFWLRALTTVVGGVARAVGISTASITVPEI